MLFSGEPAGLAHEMRPGRQRNPEVRRDFRIEAGKVRGRHARDRERAIVEDNGLADDVGIGVEVPGPEPIAQQCHERRIGGTIHGRIERLAELQPDVGNPEEVSGDDFSVDLLAAIALREQQRTRTAERHHCRERLGAASILLKRMK
jgi:hypothetical protein